MHKAIKISFGLLIMLFTTAAIGQQSESSKWIRPADAQSPAVWGLRNGIVFSLWPYALESQRNPLGGGPRGLIRVGHSYNGFINHINFIAVEPVVNGKMEFSEISPSVVDNHWGKLMWTGSSQHQGEFGPYAISKGVITNPIDGKPDIEMLSVYLFMEKFQNGAQPYLKLSIRTDRPEEIGIEIFHQNGSAKMDACHITATMGNYARLRLLNLKDETIDSRKLYKGFDDIGFIEKETYPASKMAKDLNGDLIVVAESNETFSQLSDWPQEAAYMQRSNWRYRPFFMTRQYWRKEKSQYDSSLHVRVNGRAKYWSGGTSEKNRYIDIPGGPSFENFELRENYYPGQKFFFGISRVPVEHTGKSNLPK